MGAEVYRISNDECQILSTLDRKGIKLPSALVIPPDNYIYEESAYSCFEEGLYLDIIPLKKNNHRIVYNGDILKLLQSISWIHVHGHAHDSLSFQEALEVAKSGKLRMTCGPISQFTENLLNTLNVPCRFVLILTLEEWNTYNNGHSLIEIFEDGHWVLYDIDIRNFFSLNEQKLSALEFVKAVSEKNYERHLFSKSPNFAFGDLRVQGYDFSCWYEVMFLFNYLDKWYERVAQVLFIQENGIFYFTCDVKHRKRIENYPYSGPFNYLEKEEFLNRFYPETCDCNFGDLSCHHRKLIS